ncbi:hypothetical protein LUZ60_016244 [Juncus effusus]|nr:hypothetical protein LUZ60_016244 [Juncus effusus]
MSQKSSSLHIVFFPLMAPGHFIPMVDLAHLFATRSGINCSFVTTPGNATSLKLNPNLPINLHIIPFPDPSLTALSPGQENIQSLPSVDSQIKFFSAINTHIQEPIRAAMIELKPDAIITDGFYPWTADMAIDMGIPRILFDGISYFTQCFYYALNNNKVRQVSDDILELFEFPHKFEVLKCHLHDPKKGGPFFVNMYEEMAKAEERSYATVMNTFYEIEAAYADHYRNVIGRKSWHVGPVFSCNGVEKKNDLEENECLKWLDKQEGKSVIYVSFGTFGQLGSRQLAELATGLERSGHHFLWIVRDGGDDWFPKGFFERISDRGLIVKEWGPQREILSHPAIGGFLTHCGWNSVLEAVASAVPMVTWPIFAEQFLNEKLIVDIHKFGTYLGAEKNTILVHERPIIEAEKIEKALKWITSDNEEMRDMRARMKEIGEKAKMAMEVGGSSYNDLSNLIDELIQMKISKQRK